MIFYAGNYLSIPFAAHQRCDDAIAAFWFYLGRFFRRSSFFQNLLTPEDVLLFLWTRFLPVMQIFPELKCGDGVLKLLRCPFHCCSLAKAPQKQN